MRAHPTYSQFFIAILLIFFSTIASAKEVTKILIHVTTSSKSSHVSAINSANALLREYGHENVVIEIVASGFGVGIANKKNALSKKVQSLINKDVRLSVCSGTLKKLIREGKAMPLLDEAIQVSNGNVRAVELQKEGYAYLHQ